MSIHLIIVAGPACSGGTHIHAQCQVTDRTRSEPLYNTAQHSTAQHSTATQLTTQTPTQHTATQTTTQSSTQHAATYAPLPAAGCGT